MRGAVLSITLRPVTEDDFPLLARWLAEPHVHRWWFHDLGEEAVRRDFGPVARGEEPAEDLLALVDGQPVGLVQRCRWQDYPDDLEELATGSAGRIDVPPGALSVDYLLGSPDVIGRGLGPRVIRAACEEAWATYADAPAVIVPVAAENRRSWRALEKAGFRRVGEADLEPDNPVDDRRHVVYRLDRPERSPT
jgi:aminoglycoside 6'-N-acetyltransferase